MTNYRLLALLVLALIAIGIYGHPELSKKELKEYQENVARNTEALGRCMESVEMRDINAQLLCERAYTLRHLRKARGLDVNPNISRRDKPALEKWMKVHHEKEVGHSQNPEDLFDFRWNEAPRPHPAGCALTPESIYGPYWRDEQLERQTITDNQDGVALRLSLQVIDINTCKPIHGAQVDVWSANALGEYSDKSTGFLRGWQPTSFQGTVDFNTIFPGHYPGRATHMHVLVRPQNQKRVAHTGMLYFDEYVRFNVERVDAYLPNKAEVVLVKDDYFAPFSASDKYDPFMQWAWLGPDVQDGVLAWITMGVNMSNPDIPQPGSPRKRSMFDTHLAH